MEPSDPIADLLSAPIPKKLWHYTSVAGFHAIVTTRKIFATDTRFLNDREEFSHAYKIATEVVKANPEFGPNNLPMKELLGRAVELAFLTGPTRQSRMLMFVACFSSQEDQLSQWRGYSYGTSGVSLGFELSGLRPSPTKNDALCFAPCVYADQDKKRLIRQALLHFIIECQSLWDRATDLLPDALKSGVQEAKEIGALFEAKIGSGEFADRLNSAFMKTATDILRISALLKHSSFEEEQES